jgi:hypothetical protein
MMPDFVEARDGSRMEVPRKQKKVNAYKNHKTEYKTETISKFLANTLVAFLTS